MIRLQGESLEYFISMLGVGDEFSHRHRLQIDAGTHRRFLSSGQAADLKSPIFLYVLVYVFAASFYFWDW